MAIADPAALAAPLPLRQVPPRGQLLRDLVALTKPRVTSLVLATTATGIFLAPGHLSTARILVTLIATAMVVGAANTFNCYLERDRDALMLRTRARPLAAQRLDPRGALWLGAILAGVSIPALAVFLNPLTALLAAFALVSYVWVYTPMKPRSPKALVVGAIPGAVPPLLGWTAVTGHLDLPGLWLFAVLFLWQLPHFLAITLYLKDDYARGGHQILALVRGEATARQHLLAYTLLLVPVTLGFTPLGVAGRAYLTVAGVLGALFLVFAVRGLRQQSGPRWARGLFSYSIVYLTLLFAALLIDAAPRIG